jgi:hypothetical protein
MVYHRRSYKVAWILLTEGKGQFWKLQDLVAKNSEAQTGCPVTYTYTRREGRDCLSATVFASATFKSNTFFLTASLTTCNTATAGTSVLLPTYELFGTAFTNFERVFPCSTIFSSSNYLGALTTNKKLALSGNTLPLAPFSSSHPRSYPACP